MLFRQCAYIRTYGPIICPQLLSALQFVTFFVQICLAQRAGASGVVVVSNDSSQPIFRMEGAVLFGAGLPVHFHSAVFLTSTFCILFAGTTPCDVQIAAVMVSMHDGSILRNASTLSAYSCFRPLHSLSPQFVVNFIVFVIWIVLPFMFCNVFNFYQIIAFRLMLRRTRLKPGCCFPFFQLAPRKLLVALLVFASSLIMTWSLPNSPEYPPRTLMLLPVLLCVIALVTISSVALQKIRAFRQRRKLRVVAQYKHSAETSWQSNFVERASPADGNCLFHSLADAQAMLPSARPDNDAAVTGHAAIRREIIDYFRVHCGDLSVGDTGMLLRDYVQAEMRGVSFDR
jgi:hypothetical protein